jgi:hypothetical protein
VAMWRLASLARGLACRRVVTSLAELTTHVSVGSEKKIVRE